MYFKRLVLQATLLSVQRNQQVTAILRLFWMGSDKPTLSPLHGGTCICSDMQ